MTDDPAEGWDVIVVGSGAAGLTGAVTAAAEGCRVLLLEGSDLVGGTTAISGGMVWIPANGKAAPGGNDTLEAARAYLEAVLPGGDRERLDTFLEWGPQAVRDLEARTDVQLRPVRVYPDYYPDLAGATTGGRVLEPVPFEASALGAAFSLLRPPLPEFTLFGGMMISREDIPHMRRIGRSARSALHVARLLGRYALQRLRAHRGTTLYLGNALAGRLLLSAIRLGVTIRTGEAVERLVLDDGMVVGATTRRRDGTERMLHAGKGVLLATGGLSHGGEFRARYVPGHAGVLTATVDPGLATRGARLALDAGAKLSAATEQGAFWVPASTFTRPDGTKGIFPHTVTDRAKPGLIAVDRNGARFTNEAVSYHEFVRAQLRSDGGAIPAWLLCDRPFLWKYGLGKIKPFCRALGRDIASGYLHRGQTISALAASIGVSADALTRTVEAYNGPARAGEDPAFGRGSNAYQRHLGDGDHKPNPCVAPIETAPFFAICVWPADLGMSAGIATDGGARVLNADGLPIPGLYACGNDMASVMEGAYPGPGITLGPALTFGWLAGRAIARINSSRAFVSQSTTPERVIPPSREML